jgi:hypothetical protein
MNQQIQLAYNKGLSDAENRIIDNLINLLNDPNHDVPFPNPKLEIVRHIIKDRSDYYHNLANRINNMGNSFRKKLAQQKEVMDNAR